MPPSLSPRRQQVLDLLLAGRSNKQIGKELYIDENTVKTHLRYICEKFGVKTRTELMALSQKEGWPSQDGGRWLVGDDLMSQIVQVFVLLCEGQASQATSLAQKHFHRLPVQARIRKEPPTGLPLTARSAASQPLPPPSRNRT